MMKNRRQRKKKWIGPAGILLMAGLFPAQASSPTSVPTVSMCSRVSTQTGGGGTIESSVRKGTCDAGGDCCYGREEAECTRLIGGGGFPAV